VAILNKRLLAVTLLCLSATQAAAEPVRGFWLSPDWILPSPSAEPLDPARAREAVSGVLDRLKDLRVNTLFMETFLRGYSIAPMPDRSGRALPVYSLTRLPQGHDLLSIVLDEASKRGMNVQAWVHVLFWKTDNPERVRPHHIGSTIWDDVVVKYLKEGASRLTGTNSQLVTAAADLIARQGMDDHALAQLARNAGLDPNRDGVLNSFVKVLANAGVPPPSFLVTTPSGELHVPGTKDPWMTLYLNPEDPTVLSRVTSIVERVSNSYPGLAGIHIDHIRYPKGPLSLPSELSGLRVGMTFSGNESNGLYRKWKKCLALREKVITALARRIKDVVRDGQALSAAVHPLYYFERDEWASTLSADDFVSQDWYAWGIDLAVPMVYDSDAARVGRILKRHRFGLRETWGDGARTAVAPGVNKFRLIQKGASGGLNSWVYFDFDGLRAIMNRTTPGDRQTAQRVKETPDTDALVDARLYSTDEDEVDRPSDTMD